VGCPYSEEEFKDIYYFNIERNEKRAEKLLEKQQVVDEEHEDDEEPEEDPNGYGIEDDH
jgi:hypothetical protein